MLTMHRLSSGVLPALVGARRLAEQRKLPWRAGRGSSTLAWRQLGWQCRPRYGSRRSSSAAAGLRDRFSAAACWWSIACKCSDASRQALPGSNSATKLLSPARSLTLRVRSHTRSCKAAWEAVSGVVVHIPTEREHRPCLDGQHRAPSGRTQRASQLPAAMP